MEVPMPVSDPSSPELGPNAEISESPQFISAVSQARKQWEARIQRASQSQSISAEALVTNNTSSSSSSTMSKTVTTVAVPAAAPTKPSHSQRESRSQSVSAPEPSGCGDRVFGALPSRSFIKRTSSTLGDGSDCGSPELGPGEDNDSGTEFADMKVVVSAVKKSVLEQAAERIHNESFGNMNTNVQRLSNHKFDEDNTIEVGDISRECSTTRIKDLISGEVTEFSNDSKLNLLNSDNNEFLTHLGESCFKICTPGGPDTINLTTNTVTVPLPTTKQKPSPEDDSTKEESQNSTGGVSDEALIVDNLANINNASHGLNGLTRDSGSVSKNLGLAQVMNLEENLNFHTPHGSQSEAGNIENDIDALNLQPTVSQTLGAALLGAAKRLVPQLGRKKMKGINVVKPVLQNQKGQTLIVSGEKKSALSLMQVLNGGGSNSKPRIRQKRADLSQEGYYHSIPTSRGQSNKDTPIRPQRVRNGNRIKSHENNSVSINDNSQSQSQSVAVPAAKPIPKNSSIPSGPHPTSKLRAPKASPPRDRDAVDRMRVDRATRLTNSVLGEFHRLGVKVQTAQTPGSTVVGTPNKTALGTPNRTVPAPQNLNGPRSGSLLKPKSKARISKPSGSGQNKFRFNDAYNAANAGLSGAGTTARPIPAKSKIAAPPPRPDQATTNQILGRNFTRTASSELLVPVRNRVTRDNSIAKFSEDGDSSLSVARKILVTPEVEYQAGQAVNGNVNQVTTNQPSVAESGVSTNSRFPCPYSTEKFGDVVTEMDSQNNNINSPQDSDLTPDTQLALKLNQETQNLLQNKRNSSAEFDDDLVSKDEQLNKEIAALRMRAERASRERTELEARQEEILNSLAVDYQNEGLSNSLEQNSPSGGRMPDFMTMDLEMDLEISTNPLDSQDGLFGGHNLNLNQQQNSIRGQNLSAEISEVEQNYSGVSQGPEPSEIYYNQQLNLESEPGPREQPVPMAAPSQEFGYLPSSMTFGAEPPQHQPSHGNLTNRGPRMTRIPSELGVTPEMGFSCPSGLTPELMQAMKVNKQSYLETVTCNNNELLNRANYDGSMGNNGEDHHLNQGRGNMNNHNHNIDNDNGPVESTIPNISDISMVHNTFNLAEIDTSTQTQQTRRGHLYNTTLNATRGTSLRTNSSGIDSALNSAADSYLSMNSFNDRPTPNVHMNSYNGRNPSFEKRGSRLLFTAQDPRKMEEYNYYQPQTTISNHNHGNHNAGSTNTVLKHSKSNPCLLNDLVNNGQNQNYQCDNNPGQGPSHSLEEAPSKPKMKQPGSRRLRSRPIPSADGPHNCEKRAGVKRRSPQAGDSENVNFNFRVNTVNRGSPRPPNYTGIEKTSPPSVLSQSVRQARLSPYNRHSLSPTKDNVNIHNHTEVPDNHNVDIIDAPVPNDHHHVENYDFPADEYYKGARRLDFAGEAAPQAQLRTGGLSSLLSNANTRSLSSGATNSSLSKAALNMAHINHLSQPKCRTMIASRYHNRSFNAGSTGGVNQNLEENNQNETDDSKDFNTSELQQGSTQNSSERFHKPALGVPPSQPQLGSAPQATAKQVLNLFPNTGGTYTPSATGGNYGNNLNLNKGIVTPVAQGGGRVRGNSLTPANSNVPGSANSKSLLNVNLPGVSLNPNNLNRSAAGSALEFTPGCLSVTSTQAQGQGANGAVSRSHTPSNVKSNINCTPGSKQIGTPNRIQPYKYGTYQKTQDERRRQFAENYMGPTLNFSTPASARGLCRSSLGPFQNHGAASSCFGANSNKNTVGSTAAGNSNVSNNTTSILNQTLNQTQSNIPPRKQSGLSQVSGVFSASGIQDPESDINCTDLNFETPREADAQSNLSRTSSTGRYGQRGHLGGRFGPNGQRKSVGSKSAGSCGSSSTTNKMSNGNLGKTIAPNNRKLGVAPGPPKLSTSNQSQNQRAAAALGAALAAAPRLSARGTRTETQQNPPNLSARGDPPQSARGGTRRQNQMSNQISTARKSEEGNPSEETLPPMARPTTARGRIPTSETNSNLSKALFNPPSRAAEKLMSSAAGRQMHSLNKHLGELLTTAKKRSNSSENLGKLVKGGSSTSMDHDEAGDYDVNDTHRVRHYMGPVSGRQKSSEGTNRTGITPIGAELPCENNSDSTSINNLNLEPVERSRSRNRSGSANQRASRDRSRSRTPREDSSLNHSTNIVMYNQSVLVEKQCQSSNFRSLNGPQSGSLSNPGIPINKPRLLVPGHLSTTQVTNVTNVPGATTARVAAVSDDRIPEENDGPGSVNKSSCPPLTARGMGPPPAGRRKFRLISLCCLRNVCPLFPAWGTATVCLLSR